MKCGEVLDGGLLSRDPCDFKECLAHLVNQRLMRITVTPSPTPARSLLHFVIFHRLWEEKDPQVATQFKRGNAGEGVCLICVRLCACVHVHVNERGRPGSRLVHIKMMFCNTLMTHLLNDALYEHSLKRNLILYISVCTQVFGSA